MATSAFKSTSRRGNYTSPSLSNPSLSSSSSKDNLSKLSKDSVKKTPARRSRSVSAVPRSQVAQAEYSNTRNNPLFDRSNSSSSSKSSAESEHVGIGKGGSDGNCSRRGRLGPDKWGPGSLRERQGGRSSSRVDLGRGRLRSVSRGPSLSIESDYPSSETEDGRSYQNVRSDIHQSFKAIKGKDSIDVPSDLEDPSAIVSDIRTEYSTKLEQSQERIRKLRADLAVEEQREQELGLILNDFKSSPEPSESRKSRPKRRTSVERVVVSRRLEEEAISYFEECVSISNFDGSDFSSLEQMDGAGFLSNEELAYAESLISIDQPIYHEELDTQTPRSISLVGSDLGFSCSSNEMKSPNPNPKNGLCDHYNTSDFETLRSGNCGFSFTQQPGENIEKLENRNYLEKFRKEMKKEQQTEHVKFVRSSYSSDDYVSKNLDEILLQDLVLCKNRTDSGGLVLCDIRTF